MALLQRTHDLFRRAESGRWDLLQPAVIVVLALTGVVFIHSATAYTGGVYWMKQLFWVVLGAGAYTAVSLIHYRRLLEYAHLFYALALVPLVLVLFIGVERLGAQRWIDLKVVLFQPSETAKIGTLLMVASLLARSRIGTVKESLRTLLWVMLVAGVPFLLIFLQPDLGSALVIPPMVLALLFVSQLSHRFFIAAFALFTLFLGVVAVDLAGYYRHYAENDLSFRSDRGAYEEHSILPLRDYQRERILTSIAPDLVDSRGTGASWQVRQSKIAAGSGGLWGKGLAEGTQAKLGYLPEPHTDFIFPVIAEEKGFLGSSFVIALFAILLANGIRVAQHAADRFGMLLAVGVSVIFTVHIFINIGMTIGLLPITGLPLPFLSYGGTFFLSCCLLQGMVQSVYRHRRDLS